MMSHHTLNNHNIDHVNFMPDSQKRTDTELLTQRSSFLSSHRQKR